MPSGASAIVNTLKQAGVHIVFGIPSIHNLSLYEALRHEPSIGHILCRHECTATHMADGYARAGNQLGVIIASTGPGTGYAIPAIQEAWGSCSPVLLITTNIPTSKIGKGAGMLHELENQATLFSQITKDTITVRSEKEIQVRTQEAIHRALSGRPGPVYLEIPVDLLEKEAPVKVDLEPIRNRAFELPKEFPDAVSLLQEAKQPILILGKEAALPGIAENIAFFAEKLGVPVITTTNGKGIISEENDFSFGNAARGGVVREMVEGCDVALAVGTRLREVDAKRRGLRLPGKLIHMDWNDRWIDKNFPSEIPLIGDVPAIFKALVNAFDIVPSRNQRMTWIKGMKEKLYQEMKEIGKSRKELQYLDAIREALPRQSALVIDNTQLGYWAEYFYPSHCPGGLMGAKGSSVIGFAFAAAMGVKIARPEKPVLALIGDGGFLYSSQELATCVRHRVGFPVVIVNDNAYGVISYLQKKKYEEEYESRLVNPDFVTLAKAYGIKASKVDSPDNLKNAIKEAFDSKLTGLIELNQDFPEPPFDRY